MDGAQHNAACNGEEAHGGPHVRSRRVPLRPTRRAMGGELRLAPRVMAKEAVAEGRPDLVTDTENTPPSHWPDRVT